MKFLRDLFTGSDNATYAIGRIYSLPVLIAGLAVPLLMVVRGQPVNLSEFGVMLGGLGAAVMALVAGTNSTEPKA